MPIAPGMDLVALDVVKGLPNHPRILASTGGPAFDRHVIGHGIRSRIGLLRIFGNLHVHLGLAGRHQDIGHVIVAAQRLAGADRGNDVARVRVHRPAVNRLIPGIIGRIDLQGRDHGVGLRRIEEHGLLDRRDLRRAPHGADDISAAPPIGAVDKPHNVKTTATGGKRVRRRMIRAPSSCARTVLIRVLRCRLPNIGPPLLLHFNCRLRTLVGSILAGRLEFFRDRVHLGMGLVVASHLENRGRHVRTNPATNAKVRVDLRFH